MSMNDPSNSLMAEHPSSFIVRTTSVLRTSIALLTPS
jgi:hypothetical protein